MLAQKPGSNQSRITARRKMVLLVADGLAGRVSNHHRIIHDAVPAFGDFAGIVALWGPSLNCNPVKIIHAIDTRGYSINLFQRSLNDCVDAWRNIIRA